MRSRAKWVKWEAQNTGHAFVQRKFQVSNFIEISQLM